MTRMQEALPLMEFEMPLVELLMIFCSIFALEVFIYFNFLESFSTVLFFSHVHQIIVYWSFQNSLSFARRLHLIPFSKHVPIRFNQPHLLGCHKISNFAVTFHRFSHSHFTTFYDPIFHHTASFDKRKMLFLFRDNFSPALNECPTGVKIKSSIVGPRC